MTENHDRAIGRIEGKLDRLIEDQIQANQKRDELYREIGNIHRKHDSTDQQLISIAQRIKQVETPVAEFNKWRERMSGALMLASFTAAIVGATTATFWQKIIAFFR